MPPPPFRSSFAPGPDEMVIPAFLVSDGNEAALAAWKAAHPEWFMAGSWTPGASARHSSRGAGLGSPGRPGRLPGEAMPSWEGAAARAGLPMDVASLSLADFQATASVARSGQFGRDPARPGERDSRHGDDGDDPLFIQAQSGPPRPPRAGGGMPPRSIRDEVLETRFNDAVARLRRVEPRNRELEFVRDPSRPPSEPSVLRMEAEARAAEARSRGTAGAAPSLAEAMQPQEPFQSTVDIMMPGGIPTGYNAKRAGPEIQTV